MADYDLQPLDLFILGPYQFGQQWDFFKCYLFITSVQVVAPTIQNAACREQLVQAARQVGRAVERLVEAARAPAVLASPAGEQLSAAADRVHGELERLLEHVLQGTDHPYLHI